MDAIQTLLLVADRYGEALSLEDRTISHRVFNDSKKLKALREGADLSTRRFEAAMQWLSDNWPEGAVWPDTVARPFLDSSLQGADAPSLQREAADGRSALPQGGLPGSSREDADAQVSSSSGAGPSGAPSGEKSPPRGRAGEDVS